MLMKGFILLPAAGQPVNPAIHADSSLIVAWAVSCDLERGPGLITHPDSIEVTYGEAVHATGKAGNEVVSLGDGGIATLWFERPIIDGPGADFAVFENSFDGAFLELGFAEVSSDGRNFVRFPSQSLTPVDVQVGPFDIMDPENIHNLAGKYKAGWGTAFDLKDISDSSGIDLNRITAVRIIDVVGILDDSLGSRDASGRLINDPFPTPFESGGFDLDGVGVIHQSQEITAVIAEESTLMTSESTLKVYPNPCTGELYLEDPGGTFRRWTLYDAYGRVLRNGKFYGQRQRIVLGDIPQGIYLLRCEAQHTSIVKRILKTAR